MINFLSQREGEKMELIERSLLIKLIDTTALLAAQVEQKIPPVIRGEHRQLSHHTPSPWQSLYWKYKDELDPPALDALSLRATLANVSGLLHAAQHQLEESEKTEPPDLTLKKIRRVEL